MFKIINSTIVQRLSDGAFIPVSEDNRDYQSYQQWLNEGNTPQSADPPSPMRALTTEERLTALGITIDELKDVLGLKK